MLRKGNQGKSSEPILSDLQLTGAVNRSGSLESQDTGAEPPEGEARAIHCDEAEYLQFSGSTSPLRVEQQHFGGYSSSSSFACEAEAVSERCLQVILEHEEEAASLSPAILLQRLKEVQSGRQGDALYPDDYAPADCPRVGQTTNEGPQTSQPVDGVAFDVDKTTFRHKPHVESERNRAETQQDSQVQEQVSAPIAPASALYRSGYAEPVCRGLCTKALAQFHSASTSRRTWKAWSRLCAVACSSAGYSSICDAYHSYSVAFWAIACST